MDSDVGIESGRMYMILWKASESGFIIQIGSIKRFVTSAKKALILSLHPASCRTENDSFPLRTVSRGHEILHDKGAGETR